MKFIEIDQHPGGQMKHRSDDTNYKDPVCGMVVSRLTAVAEAEHQRKTYYFCAQVCRDAFLADPKSYLRAHRQHGMPPKSMPTEEYDANP
ncbi:YHS domain-containing protein [Denitratisoma sp. DHT3]|uniref:YHS domain-containing protein n=1 Tax=Denitratisoma sp. DHT3 TaxID=1981880 RepID=UPI0021BD2F53|nr:YHS domain-containing protein [Denitratisoma sp. DHT3]